MKASNNISARNFNKFLVSLTLSEAEIEALGWQTGWSKAEPRKINLINLLIALAVESIQGEMSFNDIGSCIGTLHADEEGGPSRQAVFKRINEPLLKVIQILLARTIAFKLSGGKPACQSPFFDRYERVLVQDSTVIKLPTWLYEKFSGVSNGHQKVCNARIQAVYDIKNMAFVSRVEPNENDTLAFSDIAVVVP